MWNFAGRQNDIQGNGNRMYGNWISGIAPLDNLRLGEQSSLPDDLKTNPARTNYFLLPLLAGIAGLDLAVQARQKGFWRRTGSFYYDRIAIIIYLNQNPISHANVTTPMPVRSMPFQSGLGWV
jgi:hypothetical protein